MQAHVRHVEKFTNFMSPVGLSISHYTSSHPRKHQTFTNLTNPPNVTNNLSAGSGSESDHNQASKSSKTHTTQTVSASNPNTHHHRPSKLNLNESNDEIQSNIADNQWTRHNLSLRHERNRSMYFEANGTTTNESATNQILDKLIIYGYETSADIAKMQPWQLRVLKKEIPQIDFIFMTAYRMWGKQEYYDDTQNLTFRQYWDPAVWLQYNEIELIIKCFDLKQRGYQCMICGTSHGLNELDVVRWHIWLEHKNSTALNAIMQSSKKHNDHNFTKPLQNLQLPPLESTTRSISPNIREKSAPQIISLLDSTDDEMDVNPTKHQRNKRYNSKARSYSSRRRHNNNNNSNDNNKRRRSKRLMNKYEDNNDDDVAIISPKTVQNPIIINGCDDNYDNYDYNAVHDENIEINHSQSRDHDFMPSAQIATDINSNTHEMECDEAFMNNDEMQCDEFNMIGFNDDFSTLGVMGALSRNSSDSFNANLQLNSAFMDPSAANFVPFQAKELRIDSMNEMI